MNFLTDANQSKFKPNIILVLILSVLFLFVGQIIGLKTLHFITSSVNLPYALNDFLMLSLSFIFISIIVFLYIKFIEKRPVFTIGFYKENKLKHFLKGFLIGGLLFSIIIFLLFITNHISLDRNPNILTGYKALLPVLIIIPGWIIQGSTEEILTRGWLFQAINTRYNKYIALSGSSIFFGLMHMGNNSVSTIAIINIILVGVLFSIYTMKTNNLWGACGMHASWNFVQGNIFGLEVSGNNLFKYSIFKFNVNGNEIITGGSFGPEASIITTIIIVISIIYFINNKTSDINITQ